MKDLNFLIELVNNTFKREQNNLNDMLLYEEFWDNINSVYSEIRKLKTIDEPTVNKLNKIAEFERNICDYFGPNYFNKVLELQTEFSFIKNDKDISLCADTRGSFISAMYKEVKEYINPGRSINKTN